MRQFSLPSLFCPFPSAVSPYAQVVDEATIAWAREFRLLDEPAVAERLQCVGVGWLVSRTMPYTGRDGLQLLADWCTWLFLQDDQCDERGVGRAPDQLRAKHALSLDLLRGVAQTPDDADGAALVNLRDRMLRIGSADWMDRFAHTLSDSFEGSIWEAENRSRGVTPNVAAYMHQRAATGGLLTLLVLNEIADSNLLSRVVREHPVVKSLTRCTVNAVCWSNDIVSLAKELKQGDVHNLVLALRNEYGLTLSEALYRAAALHDAQVREFLDLQRQLPAFGVDADKSLQRYVESLRFWMRGNLDWSFASGRYLADMLDPAGIAAELA